MIKKNERRTSLRVKPEKETEIRVDLNGENFIDIFYATDISIGGIALRVPHLFEGCKINLPVDCLVRLPIPIDNSFHAQGKIIHISGERFGVAFQNLNENYENMIKDYVNYRLKEISWIAWISHKLGITSLSSRLI